MGVRAKKRGCMTRLVVVLAVALLFGAAGAYFLRNAYDRYAYPLEYQELVAFYARERELPPSLVYAVICCESGFDPEAQSNVGAKGLMQLVDETFEWAQMRDGIRDYEDPARLYEPEMNIRYGTLVLRLLLDEFGSTENAVAAYHAGWGNVKGWLADNAYSPDGRTLSLIPFGDTRAYVKKVLHTQKKYQELYGVE